MRIVTWNVNSLNARMPRVTEWLGLFEPDVLCMQETKMSDDAFPAGEFAELGYESFHHGEGQWNGVAILSKVGLDDPRANFADGCAPDAEARVCWATCNGVRVASCYVPNGRAIDHDHYQYKLAWLARLRADLDANADPGDNVVVVGDFNIAPETRDHYASSTDFENATHVSQPERDALADICGWGLTDVFREFHDADELYSWWDYRGGNFHKRKGMRIDLVLASASMTGAAELCLVDRNARKGESPSDHAPVFADFAV
ncbi:MAG: exodeoxyribonuclease III [Acidimicrobiales bacterium]|nr:exodeoxyribonuclease III [Acidimicrobiales bacterium]